jgi:hypothetical protein
MKAILCDVGRDAGTAPRKDTVGKSIDIISTTEWAIVSKIAR